MNNVFPGAVVLPSPAAWNDREGCEDWQLSLILHGTQAGPNTTAEGIAHYFSSPSAPACSHFLIGKDGNLWQFADPLGQAAAANGTCTSPSGFWRTDVNGNWYTVSIELFKQDNGEAVTEEQYAKLVEVSKWVCEVCTIPKKWPTDKNGGITSHGFFDPDHRSNVNGAGGDPGTFDWNRYIPDVQGGTPMITELQIADVAGWYEESGNGQWRVKESAPAASRGNVIGGDILKYYRRVGFGDSTSELFGMTYLGLPRTNEIGYTKKRSDGTDYRYVEQEFERGLLRFDPEKRVEFPPGACFTVYPVNLSTIFEKARRVADDTYHKVVDTIHAQIHQVLGGS